jgi:hypothetical protein
MRKFGNSGLEIRCADFRIAQHVVGTAKYTVKSEMLRDFSRPTNLLDTPSRWTSNPCIAHPLREKISRHYLLVPAKTYLWAQCK